MKLKDFFGQQQVHQFFIHTIVFSVFLCCSIIRASVPTSGYMCRVEIFLSSLLGWKTYFNNTIWEDVCGWAAACQTNPAAWNTTFPYNEWVINAKELNLCRTGTTHNKTWLASNLYFYENKVSRWSAFSLQLKITRWIVVENSIEVHVGPVWIYESISSMSLLAYFFLYRIIQNPTPHHFVLYVFNITSGIIFGRENINTFNP